MNILKQLLGDKLRINAAEELMQKCDLNELEAANIVMAVSLGARMGKTALLEAAMKAIEARKKPVCKP